MTDRTASMPALEAAGTRTGLLAGVSDLELAYTFFRFSMGVVIFFHGAMRMITGVGPWVVKEMPLFVDNPLLPMWFVVGFLWVLPTIEVVLGTLTMIGLYTRWALISGAALMLILVFGNLTRQDWGTVGNELHYILYYTLMIAGMKYNRFALDRRKPAR